MRPAGSPGTCGPLYRAKPTGDIGTPAKPPDAAQTRPEGSRGIPAQRTEPSVTTEEQTVSETTVDVDGTTEVAG